VARYSYEWRDQGVTGGKNVGRVTVHGDSVYIETEGNHDGVVVRTAVEIPRAAFVHGLRHLGGLL
jgi:hypothetical protein